MLAPTRQRNATRRWREGAFALVLALLCCAALSAPASATVTNIVGFDGESDTIGGDQISDNAEIWAYVTSPSGGTACVHPATPLPASCNDKGVFGKTPVSPFYSGMIPIAAGKLPPGQWMLIAGEGEDGEPVTATDHPFVILPCSDCAPEAYTKSPNFAAAHQNLVHSVATVCKGVKTASLLWKAKEVYQTAVFTYAFFGGPMGGMGLAITQTVQATGVAAIKASNAIFNAVLPGPLGTVAGGICLGLTGVPGVGFGLDHWMKKWANDPPDPDFTVLPEPALADVPNLPGVPEEVVDDLEVADRLRAFSQATLGDFERFQGADAADSGVYEHAQSHALSEHLFEYAYEARRTADFLTETAATLRNEFPAEADRTIAQADIDTATAFVDRLKTDGWAPEELADLEAAGFDSQTIARLREDNTAWDLTGTQEMVLDQVIDEVAQDLQDLVPIAEDFAREAAVYAGRSNQPPVAVFMAGEPSGPDMRGFSFKDNSSSPDHDPLEITWDFGDATEPQTAAAGATVHHTYAEDGIYQVTMTAADKYSSAGITQQVRTGPPNVAPTASFTATPDEGQEPLEVQFDASASSDPDGTIDTYEWDFGDGTTGSSSAQQNHTYGPGSFVATLKVIDDEGATHTTTRDIAVADTPEPPAAVVDNLAAAPVGVIDVFQSDADPDGDDFELVSHTQPPNGRAECSALGACMYEADAGFTGDDEFEYTIRDTTGREASATVAVTVSEPPPVGDPVASDDEVATGAGQLVEVDVLANDQGTGPLTVKPPSEPGHGGATCTAAGDCTYEPDAGFSGRDGFAYTVVDDQDREATAEVHVIVAPAEAGFTTTVTGAPGDLFAGDGAGWAIGARAQPPGISQDELDPTSLEVQLSGQHSIKPGSMTAAPGWALAGSGASAGAGALLGEAVTQPLARPLKPTSQGTGGDGHVPILVGSKVYAFFHHQWPTQISCLDRATGTRCPGYPITTGVGASPIIGPGVVVGDRIYVRSDASGSYAQTASLSLFCWDTKRARPCGLTIVARLKSTSAPNGSAPVLAAGKIYFAGDGGKLYCVDPATNRACGTLPTGLALSGSGYDSVTHGSRVYVSLADDKTACLDVAAGAPCPGWAGGKGTGAVWNLVNRFSSTGAATGVCVVSREHSRCYADASPAQPTEHPGWPTVSNYYGATQEAEVGTRTLYGELGEPGLGCWDWVTMAPCAGARWGAETPGWVQRDQDDEPLPTAYGTTWDGSCAIAVGDPGLVFTMDPEGTSPCGGVAAAQRRTIDLRAQRCDGTTGAARWARIELQDAAPGDLATAVVTVRDAATNAVLMTGDLTGGPLDLSSIDAAAHPAVVFDATATSGPTDAAWADHVPPRIRLAWNSDVRQLCFETTTPKRCDSPFEPIGVSAGKVEKLLTVKRPLDCVDPKTEVKQEPKAEVRDRTEVLLGCTDRKVVLEDVFAVGKKVSLLGVAHKSFAGSAVELVFAATRKVVARAVIAADGSFSATAPAPAAKLAKSNKARYFARIGSEQSLNLKLARRMLVTGIAAAAGKVTITGRVIGPLAAKAKDRRIALQQVVACSKAENVSTFAPRANGSFSVTVPAPATKGGVVYRLSTKVRANPRSKKLSRTFTLPRAVQVS